MSIMGVVVDIIGAAKRISSSGDYMRTIIIGDPSTHINSTGNDDTNVALYRKTPAETDGFQVGMPVVFRNLTVRLAGVLWTNPR